MHHYLGMYDISCDKIRYKVYRTLLAFGIHQQKSVFECRLSIDQKQQLIQHLDALTAQVNKRIIFIKIYPNHKNTVFLGEAKRVVQSNCLYIG
ncbi:CRISPR-associated endonuclease Cas2 [Acinetobacter sp. NIPH 1869]|uniref:CRISPR-associated endonuclease Cas2 n=1 Tax=Acinetobacter higginsii TaxID=70347 RepID=UPI001F4BB11C|nr:CRISPR-associated endonuclease Cas2 [Acinetobacter higginsii]MCH7306276.1 CRISPR-associated endonuclease Cas2 [Acinetobacter higginsii]